VDCAYCAFKVQEPSCPHRFLAHDHGDPTDSGRGVRGLSFFLFKSAGHLGFAVFPGTIVGTPWVPAVPRIMFYWPFDDPPPPNKLCMNPLRL
jgi:hypothetical protein